MSEGYVKLHRQLLEWEWFADSATVHVLTYLMITANWKEAKWMGVTIPPGGTVTSREKIAAHTGLSEKQVRLALDKLEKGRVIERDRAGKGQLVTLVNWAKYQGEEQEQGRQRASHRADEGPTKGQPSGRKRAAIEEGQEVKQDNNTEGRKRPRTQTWTLEQFQDAFRAVVHANPDRLAKSERTPFYAYWTEADLTGRMRFQSEKFFDVGRRMDTWQRNNFGKSNGNRLGHQMTKAEADAILADIRKAHDIAPGGIIETHLIPKDVLEVIRKP